MAASVEEWRQNKAAPLAADTVDLDAFRWEARPVVVMAPSADDADFTRQMEVFAEAAAEIAERDMVIVTDTDPQADGTLRRKLSPQGFAVYLIGKDGGVKFSAAEPVGMSRLAEIIDAMPMRRREMRDDG
ncbi:protein of unknown function [Paracoccus isoporae]|uniref:DUF4174 domain-containing protein n=2 Tax=Paracoccus isoporae TaxID=591205 RepID=A0A1G6W8C6_9RHOB|nr:protein of unknown function [Paracoccus isoporae]